MCCGGDKEKDEVNLDNEKKEEKGVKNKKIKIIVALIMGLIGVGMAATAYSLLANHVDGLAIVVQVWEEKPVVEIAMTTAESCPAGFAVFGGARTFSYCDSTAKNGTVNYNATCESSDGALSQTRNVTMNKFMGNLVCVKRAGKNAFQDPPIKTSASCTGNKTKCASTTADGYTMCVDAGQPCPISAFKLAFNVSASDPMLEGYEEFVNFTVPVFEEVRNYTGSSTNTTNAPYTFSTRIVDNVPARLYLTRKTGLPVKNLIAKAHGLPCALSDPFSGCDSSSTNEFRDKRFTSAGATTQSQFLMANDVPPTNLTGDVNMWQRTDILWKQECPSTRLSVKNNLPSVENVRSTQIALLVVQAVVFALVTCYLGYKLWKADNDDEEEKLQKNQKRIKLVASIIKWGVTFLAMFLAFSIAGYFTLTATARCSDTTTNATFLFLSDKINSIGGVNVANQGVDTAGVVLDYGPAIMRMCGR